MKGGTISTSRFDPAHVAALWLCPKQAGIGADLSQVVAAEGRAQNGGGVWGEGR